MQTLSIGPLALECGQTLPDVELAFVAHGKLAPDGRNAVLVTHGYTSGPSMLSLGHHTAEGSWAPLLGPGRPLDTDRFFIVCSNMLGSSFGSTGPSSVRPGTDRPWGPDFPAITLGDIVQAQHQLMRSLGVQHLQAVVGPSYGGMQALQWTLAHPGMVSGCGVVVSGLFSPPGLDAASARAKFSDHPDWHDGWHYGHPGLRERMFELRQQTLRHYGLERLYQDRYADPQERQARMDQGCRDWAERFDPNSMVVLAEAACRFDARPRVHEIATRLLLVQCTTDLIFPPDAETRALMQRTAGPARYTEFDSPYGHMAPGVEWRRLEDELRWLLP